jgi:hypothetical protein
MCPDRSAQPPTVRRELIPTAQACRQACPVSATGRPALPVQVPQRIACPLPYPSPVPNATSSALDLARHLRATATDLLRVADQLLELVPPATRRRSLAEALLAARVPRREIVHHLVAQFGCSRGTACLSVRDALRARTAAATGQRTTPTVESTATRRSAA